MKAVAALKLTVGRGGEASAQECGGGKASTKVRPTVQEEHGGPRTLMEHGAQTRRRSSRLGSIRECGATPPIERRRRPEGPHEEQHALLHKGALG